MKDERLRTQGPEPSAARLGLRAFSTGGVGLPRLIHMTEARKAHPRGPGIMEGRLWGLV